MKSKELMQPKEYSIMDSHDPNKYVREGFADDVIRTLGKVTDGDTISVAHYNDALAVKIVKNATRPQLRVNCHVRKTGATFKLQ